MGRLGMSVRSRFTVLDTAERDLMGIRVELPAHLCRLAGIEPAREVMLEPAAPTLAGVLDALEARYPMLRNTLRDAVTGKRRPFIRFYACQEDLSHAPTDQPLPPAIISGKEALLIIGAIAGG